METAESFLKNLVKWDKNYIPSNDDHKKYKYEGAEKYIFGKLNSTKFKASKMPPDLELKVKEKIAKSVKRKLPIHITVPFGGFKKWQLPSYPHVDWAEVFNITYLREYLAPIAAVYEPGVLLNYYSDEVFVSKMNNYPQEDLDFYNDEFKDLLILFQDNFPNRLILKFSKIRDEISQEELLKRFDKTIKELKAKWVYLPEEERRYRLKKAERNYKSDFAGMSEQEKANTVFNSTLVHDAFIFGDWDKDVPWAFGELMIALGFNYTGNWGIHVKSSRSSTVQFWVGYGILYERGNTYLPGILTYNQFLQNKDGIRQETVNIFKGRFPNLGSVPVLSH